MERGVEVVERRDGCEILRLSVNQGDVRRETWTHVKTTWLRVDKDKEWRCAAMRRRADQARSAFVLHLDFVALLLGGIQPRVSFSQRQAGCLFIYFFVFIYFWDAGDVCVICARRAHVTCNASAPGKRRE